MMYDKDIYRSAQVLIDQHGDEALLQAMFKEHEFLEGGDNEAAAIWKRVCAAIIFLTDTENITGQECH